MTTTKVLSIATVLSLALTAPVLGQSASAGGQGQSQAEMTAPPATATADAQAQANAEAELQVRKSLHAIKEKGAKVSEEARSKAEAKLDAAAKKTDAQAKAAGDAKVAARLGAEFKMSPEQIMAEKQELDCSWGELMIAHSLDINSKADVTTAQLMQLRQDGTGWGQIAAGLGLKLGEVVSAVQAEGRVAAGLAKPDGKVAVIHGEGARAGVAAGASAGTGVNAGGLQAGAQTRVGVGVKIKP